MSPAGSKLEAAIAEGPEALQKFINSGEIEELQDVLPHDDEHDYLNDAYLDDDNDESGASGGFRGQLQHHMQGPGLTLNLDEKMNTLRFGDNSDMDMRHVDQDMRELNRPFGNNMMNLGDIDLRNPHNQDMDFRSRDYDMRRLNTEPGDEDFRVPFNRDQDFRNSRYDEDGDSEMYEDEYGNYQDPRDWHHGGNFNQRNQNFGSNGHHFQSFRNQGPGFGGRNDQFRQPDEYWSPNPENFRGRGGRGGPRGSASRGNPRGRANLRQNRGSGGRGQGARGGPPNRGGAPRGRNLF